MLRAGVLQDPGHVIAASVRGAASGYPVQLRPRRFALCIPIAVQTPPLRLRQVKAQWPKGENKCPFSLAGAVAIEPEPLRPAGDLARRPSWAPPGAMVRGDG